MAPLRRWTCTKCGKVYSNHGTFRRHETACGEALRPAQDLVAYVDFQRVAPSPRVEPPQDTRAPDEEHPAELDQVEPVPEDWVDETAGA